MRFAADPTKVRFPAIVLTHAKISHDLVTFAPLRSADSAIRDPSNNTIQYKTHACHVQKHDCNNIKNEYPCHGVNQQDIFSFV